MRSALRSLPTVVGLLLLPIVLAAATAPTTPTFLFSWGNYGTAPGQFSSPSGVATNSLGDVYIADQLNNRIQRFNRLGNFVLQWGGFGSGNGQFEYPYGVATDAAGNVYVADYFNDRIQKFTSTGGFVAKWGLHGSGNGQFINPVGVATDRAGNVYVADFGNHRVQKFSSAGGYITQWGSLGAGNGQFNYVAGVATDATGNVYATDYLNHRIQKFSSAGAYLTQWGSSGSGSGQFSNPTGVATDPVGNVYVVDFGNNRMQKFDDAGTYLTQWGSLGSSNGQFNSPFGAAVDAAGNVYVADLSNNRIQKFSGAGATLSEPPPSYLLTWGTFGAGDGEFDTIAGMVCDYAGNDYITDSGLHRIQNMSSVGVFYRKWGSYGTGNGQFQFPGGIALDNLGYVYVVDRGNYRIEKFTVTGTFVTAWGTFGSGNRQFNNPNDVAADANGNTYVADDGNNRIQAFDSATNYLTQWGSPGSGNGQFDHPTAVALDAGGNVYVVDELNYRVQKFSSTGAYITKWGSQGSGNGQFDRPDDIAVDAEGNVYVADALNHRIQKFTSNGTYLAKWGSPGTGNGQFFYPGVVTADGIGNVYVTGEVNLTRIQKFITRPVVALVSDVPNDQGRQVLLRILHSSGDHVFSGSAISGYEVYRRYDPIPSAAVYPVAEEARGNLAAPASTPLGVQLAGWTYLQTFPAHGESEYDAIVPTLVDATSSSLQYSAFMVRAITPDPYVFYDSAVEYGFSIDNLSPPAPSPFTASYSAGATRLHWGVSVASDFASFRLYRGASPDFPPGPGTLVVATTDTSYADGGPAGSYYKLSAVDFNDNESPYAALGPNQTTDVPEGPAVSFELEGVRPNPASGSRMIVDFALTGAGLATLELIDVAGRRVVERAVGALGAGRHAVDLAEGRPLPPGVYLVRLTDGARTRVVRSAVLR